MGVVWGGGGARGNVFLAFYAISNISRKINSGNKFHLMFSSCVFYARSNCNIFKNFFGNIDKVPLHINERWFLQIDIHCGNIYPIYIYIKNCHSGVSF